MTKPRLLILDEPVGGMNEQETQVLVKLIIKLQSQGYTILLIEHDMNLVMKRIHILLCLNMGPK